MASMLRQLRLDQLFSEDPKRSPRRFTLVVPTNSAWEKAQMDFSKAYNTLVTGRAEFPDYVSVVLEAISSPLQHIRLFLPGQDDHGASLLDRRASPDL